MTTLDQLLHGIATCPKEHCRWLILADYLEDQGDPRAELVRETWAAKYSDNIADRRSSQAKLQNLLDAGIQPVRPTITLPCGLTMVWVPAGSFWKEGHSSESKFRHETKTWEKIDDPLWVLQTPLTCSQWYSLRNPASVGATCPKKAVRAMTGFRDYYTVARWCRLYQKKHQISLKLLNNTDWEYVCRAGSCTRFHFGDTASHKHLSFDNLGWQKGRRSASELCVGRFPPNAWGLFDCHGLVNELCVGDDNTIVCRGGSCASGEENCQSASVRRLYYVNMAYVGVRFHISNEAAMRLLNNR